MHPVVHSEDQVLRDARDRGFVISNNSDCIEEFNLESMAGNGLECDGSNRKLASNH